MDPVLRQLQEARKTAIAERNRADEVVRKLDALIADYTDSNPPEKASEQGDMFDRPPRTRAERAEYVTRMMTAAEDLILLTERPLTRSELLDGLQFKGFEVEGSDKSKVLGTNLWRSNRFVSLKGAGYWPKSAPLPAEFRDAKRRASMLDEQ
jgi:hypothetical protein